MRLMRPVKHSGPRRQKGFSLIEVLVAAVILSVGLLGVAGMQAAGLRYNQNAYLRSMAMVMVQDLVDRMRANPDGVRNTSFYDNINSGSFASDPGCANAGCTPAQLATYDIAQWAQNTVGSVPGATATVTRNGELFTMTVSWTRLGDDLPADAAQTVVYFRAPEL